LYVRHWDHWLDHKISHVFLQRVARDDDGWYAEGAPIDIIKGFDMNSPVPTWGGSEQIVMSPQGDKIALTTENIAHNRSWTTGWDNYVIDVIDGGMSTGEPRLLTDYIDARTLNPVFSPDGNSLLYGTM